MVRIGRFGAPRALGRVQAALTSALALFLALISLAPAAFAASPVTIVITDTLEPKDVTVEPGTTVTWINNDDERHRVRSQSGPIEFDSGNLEAGQAFSMSFDVAGTYSYVDERNDENTAYHGTIVVSSEAPPPTDPPPGGSGGETTIDIVDRLFQPAAITVDTGTTVTWVNIDDEPHTVTASGGSFDSGIFDTGGTYARTFDAPGTFAYFCILHPDMVGTVIVTGTGDTNPPPPPPEPEPDPTPPPQPVDGDVTIFDNGFTPASLTVKPGSTVTWANTGSLPHTVTDTAGRFGSGFLMAGDSYSRTFDTTGTYSYLCTIHPEMTATIFVSDGVSEPPPPPTEPDAQPGPPGDTQSPSGDITIIDNDYRPGTIEAGVGSTLTWVNTGALPHTVTDRGAAFDSGILMTGNSYSRTFSETGTFEYICTIHPEMVGVVRITQGGPQIGSGDTSEGGFVPAIGSNQGPPGALGAAASAAVNVIDLDYDPRNLTVTAGTTVVWTNAGDLPHTVTAEGVFDSGIMMTGDTFMWAFADPGTYAYLCTLHPGMEGTVIVEAAAGDNSSSSSGPLAADTTPADHPVAAESTGGDIRFLELAVIALFAVAVLVLAAGVMWAYMWLKAEESSPRPSDVP